jgi:hypothetical protein
LNQFIEGWILALPYIQEGGRIKMILPSVFAYGCTVYPAPVPPNSPLYYDIVLIKLNKEGIKFRYSFFLRIFAAIPFGLIILSFTTRFIY